MPLESPTQSPKKSITELIDGYSLDELTRIIVDISDDKDAPWGTPYDYRDSTSYLTTVLYSRSFPASLRQKCGEAIFVALKKEMEQPQPNHERLYSLASLLNASALQTPEALELLQRLHQPSYKGIPDKRSDIHRQALFGFGGYSGPEILTVDLGEDLKDPSYMVLACSLLAKASLERCLQHLPEVLQVIAQKKIPSKPLKMVVALALADWPEIRTRLKEYVGESLAEELEKIGEETRQKMNEVTAGQAVK